MQTAESKSNPYSIAAAALAGASSLPWSASVLGAPSLHIRQTTVHPQVRSMLRIRSLLVTFDLRVNSVMLLPDMRLASIIKELFRSISHVLTGTDQAPKLRASTKAFAGVIRQLAMKAGQDQVRTLLG